MLDGTGQPVARRPRAAVEDVFEAQNAVNRKRRASRSRLELAGPTSYDRESVLRDAGWRPNACAFVPRH